MAEFKIWAPELRVGIYKKVKPTRVDVLVLPDTLIHKAKTIEDIKDYRRMFFHYEGLFIYDEAHRLKNLETKRARAVLAGSDGESAIISHFDSWLFLSGTPMPNGTPIEMYPIISRVVPELIDHMSMHEFGLKYCKAHSFTVQYRNKRGQKVRKRVWNYSGASNLKDLADRVIGKFMIRIKKDKVLDLPEKIEELFIISGSMSPKLKALDDDIGRRYDKDKDLVRGAFSRGSKDELHMMTYRKLLGLEKVRHAIRLVSDFLEETNESIIVYGFHTEVIQGLVEGLQKYEPFVITGNTKVQERQRQVDAFQRGQTRLFIGNYIAMGVGFTLTRATHVLFVEFDWTPGVNDQASDRPHRIGQSKNVFVRYMIFENSLDKKVFEEVMRKRASIKLIE